MNTTKTIKKKKVATEYRFTIDELHDKKMKYFEKYYTTLPSKQKKLKEKEKKLESLEKYNIEYHNLSEEVENLKTEIEKMESQSEMMDYLMNIQPILLKMEDLKNKTIKSDKYDNVSENSILNYVDFKGVKAGASLVEEYLEAIGEKSSSENNKSINHNTRYMCDKCNIDMFVQVSNATCICKKCGLCKYYSSEHISQWSDEVEIIQPYLYKRINHFEDHLKRFQAKESKSVPDTLIQSILLELNKRKITEPKHLKPKLIKDILRRIGQANYYDNVNSIICILTGKKAPKFTKELEEKLVVMFNMIQKPFEKHKHKAGNRSNFPSYPYIIHKMLQIIGEKEPYVLKFLPWFPLLKSRDKLYTLDKIWEGITSELGWEFKKSI